MLNYLRKKLCLKSEQVPIAVENYGNTGPASIPLTVCHHFANKGHHLNKAILSGFGVGLSWGSVALNLKHACILKPLVYKEKIKEQVA